MTREELLVQVALGSYDSSRLKRLEWDWKCLATSTKKIKLNQWLHTVLRCVQQNDCYGYYYHGYTDQGRFALQHAEILGWLELKRTFPYIKTRSHFSLTSLGKKVYNILEHRNQKLCGVGTERFPLIEVPISINYDSLIRYYEEHYL